MKSMITVALFSVLSISQALASDSQLVCSTALNQSGGSLSIVIPPFTGNTAVLKGTENGGMAHFIALIGPYTVDVRYEADMVIFSNEQDGVDFRVVTSPMGGKLVTTATYKQGIIPAETLTCNEEAL
jgi:hypothetical protein